MPAFSPLLLVSPWRLWRDARIGGTVALAAGLIIALLGVLYWLPLLPVQSWPATEGEIVSSAVRSTVEWGRAGPIPFSAVDVTYTYRVGGQTLTSSRLSYGADSPVYSDPARALQVAAQYPPGQTVTVHFDPANPGTALLQVDVDTTPGPQLIALGMFFVIFGIAILVIFRHRPAQE